MSCNLSAPKLLICKMVIIIISNSSFGGLHEVACDSAWHNPKPTMSGGSIQWCAGDSSCWFMKADCVHFRPILSSAMSYWLLEISHGRDTCTMEIGKHHISAFNSTPLLESKSV